MKPPACALLVLAIALPTRGAPSTPDVRYICDPNHPGTWTMPSEIRESSSRMYGTTPEQVHALSAHHGALAEVIRRAPVFDPPRGFEARALARFHPFGAWWIPSGDRGTDVAACRRFPLMEVEAQRALVERLKKENSERLSGREQRIRDVGTMYEQIEKDPVKRQKMLHDALKVAAAADEAMARSMTQLDGTVSEKEHRLLDVPRAELQRMSPEERAAAAWYGSPGDATASGLVPAGTPGTREVVTLNLDYFDKARSRSDIQLISVTLNSQCERRTGPDAVSSAVRLDEFRDGADWARTASIVEPAR